MAAWLLRSAVATDLCVDRHAVDATSVVAAHGHGRAAGAVTRAASMAAWGAKC